MEVSSVGNVSQRPIELKTPQREVREKASSEPRETPPDRGRVEKRNSDGDRSEVSRGR